MDTLTDEELLEYCARASGYIYRKYSNALYIDRLDVQQDLWIWASPRRARFAEWLTAETEDERKFGQRKLMKSLTRQADRICRSKKARLIGYETRDEAFYPPEMVGELAEAVWDPDSAAANHGTDEIRTPSNPAEGNSRVASLSDVKRAMGALSEDELRLVILKYRDGFTMAQIADLLEISKSTAERRVNGILKKMSEFLGGESPWR